MISLIALVIAFLTLLTPSSVGTRQAPGTPEPTGGPAMWAEMPDPFAPLLGDWIATVALPEGDSEVTSLRISEAPEAGSNAADRSFLVSMGQGDECFTGPLAAHFDRSEVVFAGSASCLVEELGMATISGRRVGDGLTGSAYLPKLQRLVTWTARPAQPSGQTSGKSAIWRK